MRLAHSICDEPQLSQLAPRSRKTGSQDPLAQHEDIVYQWLGQGGKRSRPFITLATHDALKGAAGTLSANATKQYQPVSPGTCSRRGRRSSGVP